MFKEVEEFNKTIIGIDRPLRYRIDSTEIDFFKGLLQEEIKEFSDAWTEEDFVGQVDALIDLIYFAAGGLVRLGVPSDKSEAIFAVVHSKNMSKKKGVKDRETTGDTDAIKPEGWVAPEALISEILQG